MTYQVILASVGNPDLNQDFTSPISPTKCIDVPDLPKASMACREYIKEHSLGGGNWIGGQVFDSKGDLVASISYNGRIWGDEESIQQAEATINSNADIIADAEIEAFENYIGETGEEKEARIQDEIQRIENRLDALIPFYEYGRKRLDRDDPVMIEMKGRIKGLIEDARELGATDDHLQATI